MDSGTRNSKVVIFLILAMTAGARTLLWLEPSGKHSEVMPLTATGGAPVQDVCIEYARAGEVRDVGVDCLILPDGQCDWRWPSDPHVRLVVVGSDADELARVQERALLATLFSVSLGRGGRTVPVQLDPGSDVLCQPSLPPQARDLRDLLVLKGFIE